MICQGPQTPIELLDLRTLKPDRRTRLLARELLGRRRTRDHNLTVAAQTITDADGGRGGGRLPADVDFGHQPFRLVGERACRRVRCREDERGKCEATRTVPKPSHESLPTFQ